MYRSFPRPVDCDFLTNEIRPDEEKFSIGTEPYLEYCSALVGLKTWLSLTGGIDAIHDWVHLLTKKCINEMKNFGIFEIYRNETLYSYGPIIAFNVRRPDGSYYRPGDIFRLLEANKIIIRSGCFCNLGGCMSALNMSEEDLKYSFENGHSCGDEIDLGKFKNKIISPLPRADIADHELRNKKSS